MSISSGQSSNSVDTTYTGEPTRQWISTPDEKLAADLFKNIAWDRVKPVPNRGLVNLCARCSVIKMLRPCDLEYDPADLQLECKICNLLAENLSKTQVPPSSKVQLRYEDGTVSINYGPDLLSLYTAPGTASESKAQTGLPKLPHQASEEQFALLREWIRSCDSSPSHARCHRENIYNNLAIVPTRLIDVAETIRVVSTKPATVYQYVALSHCWGKLEKHQKFCLYKDNIDRLRTSINYELLPQNFKDAVLVTRGLGLKYLWIDSLCIIQDDSDDWAIESSRMEDVFTSAYVTVSAVSAASSIDGFLGIRTPRACIEIETTDNRPLYVCSSIDDFHKDVLSGAINKRGWVLQERVLSRRSIYYTSTQVYWECGEGIRCETLRGLVSNCDTSFLGDANFPWSLAKCYGGEIMYSIQQLCELYSSLVFSHASDRAVAIWGIQKRLDKASKMEGGEGLRQTAFLNRGLLWQRGQVQPMKKITHSTGLNVPSWSWLSKEGVIEHGGFQFNSVSWYNFDITRTQDKAFGELGTLGYIGISSLHTVPTFCARASSLSSCMEERMGEIIFDEEADFKICDLKCVIVGQDKCFQAEDEAGFHCLIIQKAAAIMKQLGETVYERVGVASLRRGDISSQICHVTMV